MSSVKTRELVDRRFATQTLLQGFNACWGKMCFIQLSLVITGFPPKNWSSMLILNWTDFPFLNVGVLFVWATCGNVV